MNNSIVFVLGMHRSGTSMITHMVEQSGYHCGDNLQPPGSDNPNGYWEDLILLQINEMLLRALGKDWSSLGMINANDIKKLDCYTELKSKAVHYLTQQVDQYNRVVVKDPRFCTLLPFWLSVATELDAQCQFLIIKRSAADIVKSLVTRDLMDPVYAMQLVLCNWAQIAIHLIGNQYDWCSVEYESVGLTSEHAHLAAQLANFLQVDKQQVQIALAHYQADLNHANVKQPSYETIAFDFQRPFCEAFPCAMSKLEQAQYHALSGVHQSLSFWGDRRSIIQKVAQSIVNFSHSLKHQPIVLYGAGTVAKTLVGHLSNQLICGVDQALTIKTTLLNMDFHPVSYLEEIEQANILVTVTGRKQALQQSLSQYSHRLIFIEDYFDDQTHY